MRNKVLTVVILALLFTVSGCTKSYHGDLVIVEPEDAVFKGIHPASFEGNKNTVILLHGMCTHDKDWLSNVTKKLGFVASASDKPLAMNSATDVQVYKAGWQDANNSINFYGIIYSPELNKVKKEYLCSDVNQERTPTDFCTGLPKPETEYNRTRASLNNSLKNVLMNDCLADAVVYLGEAGVKVRQGVRDAITFIEKDSANNKSPITLVSQSLGSKVLRDALVCDDEMSNATFRRNEIVQKNRNLKYLSSTQQVFMLSNQIALLNSGDSGQCKVIDSADKSRAFVVIEKNKNNVFDLFDIISNTKRANLRGSASEKSFNVVSFTDPNDLLSYEVNSKDYKNYPVTNVIVSNEGAFMGYIANPIAVHKGYFGNRDVSKFLRCGKGLKKDNSCK